MSKGAKKRDIWRGVSIEKEVTDAFTQADVRMSFLFNESRRNGSSTAKDGPTDIDGFEDRLARSGNLLALVCRARKLYINKDSQAIVQMLSQVDKTSPREFRFFYDYLLADARFTDSGYKDYEEPIRLLEESLEGNPGFAPSMRLLAGLYSLRGRHAEALVAADRLGIRMPLVDMATVALRGVSVIRASSPKLSPGIRSASLISLPPDGGARSTWQCPSWMMK